MKKSSYIAPRVERFLVRRPSCILVSASIDAGLIEGPDMGDDLDQLDLDYKEDF